MTKYYTLLQRDTENNRWMIEFGDFDRACVKDELAIYRDNGTRRKDLQIITTDESQDAINAAVDILNAS